MTIGITERLRIIVPLLAMVAATVAGAGAAHAGIEEPAERAVTLAELGYTNGVTAAFSIDEISRDLGFIQNGAIGRNGPLIDDEEGRSFLEIFLEITPAAVPVPQLIADSHPAQTPLPTELSHRKITTDVVRVTGLTAPPAAAAVTTCWSKHYGWVQWYDPSGNPNPMTVHHSSKAYVTWTFGSKKKYSNSFIANCGNQNARHRIYYGDLYGWNKHWHSLVIPGHWEAVKKGSVKRDRMVRYDDGWGYTRSGRFHN